MDRKDIQDRRRDSAKTRGENWLRQNAQNIAERTIGEEFLQLAIANDMSLRYQQSLVITIDDLTVTVELDYADEDDTVPLGIFFEEGTKDHWIEPVQKEALHWIEDGKGFFSKGHQVTGIQPRWIIKQTFDNAMPKFKAELKAGLEKFYDETSFKWQGGGE